MTLITGLGQDSHAFTAENKPLVLAGVTIPDAPGLAGNSDADVIIHALCNAVSSIDGKPFLGPRADAMCRQGITDSSKYLKAQLQASPVRLEHVAVSIEAAQPKLLPWLDAMRTSLARHAGLDRAQIGMTATSGERLSAYGKGKGIMATVVVTARLTPAEKAHRNAPLLVLITCPDQPNAERIAAGLVENRYAACVQQLPIRSTYEWQRSIAKEQEILLLVKTRRGCYNALQAWVKQEHPYQLPQIVAVPVCDGWPDYLKWLVDQTT